uniref:Transposase n=1 Tax=Meloidogyne hapla TaxID=6305 RepID=A0A1I8BQB7_MELHA
MPLMERLIYADAYHLDKLKNYILKSLTGAGLREFYDENQSAMHLLGMELLIQLTQRICSRCAIRKKGDYFRAEGYPEIITDNTL